jgi:hypothetical protein
MRLALSAYCIALVLVLPAWSRADLITPDSIVRPPPATVGSAPGTAVTTLADLVANQYAAVGVQFLSPPGPVAGTGPAVVVTNLGGVDVWASATRTEAMADRVAVLDYRSAINGQLAQPTNALTVEVVGTGASLLAFDHDGHQLGFGQATGQAGPHDGQLLTVQAAGISSFVVTGPLLMDPLPPLPVPQPWGVAEVLTAPISAPEPAGWLLAVVGAGGAVAAWRRRGQPRLCQSR